MSEITDGTGFRFVILSERSESKDLRIYGIFAVKLVRRSFDFGLRPPLRMTAVVVGWHF